MRNLIVGAALAMLAVAAPAAAHAEIVGHVTIGYENNQFDPDNNYYYEGYNNDFNYDGPFIEANVIGAIPDTHLLIAGDARIQTQSVDYGYYYGSDNFEESSGHAAIYLAGRNEDHAIAGYYGIQSWYGESIQAVGADVQKYFDRWTFEAVASYGKHDGPNYDEFDAWHAGISGTVFFGDNTAVRGGVGYSDWNYDEGDSQITSLEISAEHRFANSPYSVSAGYVYGDVSDTYDDYTADLFQVAFTVDLGSPSLRARNREGASFEAADSFDLHQRLWNPTYYSY